MTMDYADLIYHRGASKAANRGGNAVGHETQFGIIRKAALYAGHAPDTVRLFERLLDEKKGKTAR